jgi:hypothetical protein
MRMTASWCDPARIDRIQVCGAVARASGELLSDRQPTGLPNVTVTIPNRTERA